MPLYQFKCEDCRVEFEELASFDDSGAYEGVHCPACNSARKTKLPSMFGFNFTNPVGTDRWNNGTYGHDYRFKSKAPSVASERAAAEAASHMGSQPYNQIDDISGGDFFGQVE